jgi:cytochrome b6-f complex iron-sulfur subunit
MAGNPTRPAAQPVRPAAPRRPSGRKPQVSRRTFLRNAWLATLGASLVGFGAGTVYFLWPNLSEGFGAKIKAGTKSELDAAIAADGYFYSPEGRFYVVPYDGNGTDTIYKGVATDGYMALYQRCVHLGCRVPYCATSHWWECPCHGSQYNRAGEYKLGPAPRGLDRFQSTMEGGALVVDTSTVVTGPPRGTNTTGQQLEGPHCITSGGGE